jgi:hypothetical protein
MGRRLGADRDVRSENDYNSVYLNEDLYSIAIVGRNGKKEESEPEQD